MGQKGSLHLQVIPMIQEGLGESLQQGRQGMSQGQLEGGMHLDHRVRTSHCLLLADFLGKAHLDKAQRELQGQKEMVQLGKEQGLQVAVLELLQVGTAQGTGQGTARETGQGTGQGTDQGLQGWRETALELLVQVDIVQVSLDHAGTHQALKEVLDIALVLQDQRKMGNAPAPLGQMIRRQSQPERRAGWELLGLSQAILGLKKVEGWRQGQMG